MQDSLNTLAANHPLQQKELTLRQYEQNLNIMANRLHGVELEAQNLLKHLNAAEQQNKTLRREVHQLNKRCRGRNFRFKVLLGQRKLVNQVWAYGPDGELGARIGYDYPNFPSALDLAECATESPSCPWGVGIQTPCGSVIWVGSEDEQLEEWRQSKAEGRIPGNHICWLDLKEKN